MIFINSQHFEDTNFISLHEIKVNNHPIQSSCCPHEGKTAFLECNNKVITSIQKIENKPNPVKKLKNNSIDIISKIKDENFKFYKRSTAYIPSSFQYDLDGVILLL